MPVRNRILKGLNGLVNACIALCLAAVALFCVFSLWDNQQVYAAVEDAMEDLLRVKPADENLADGADFSELLAINPDVCAWVTMDGTKIDHPIVQGEDNMEYLNKDVYGEFALSGSIFLDTRCPKDFSAPYSLVYGHHMENKGMFGSLHDYKDKAFFKKNTTGTLLLPDRAYHLDVISVVVTNAGDRSIFDPVTWETGVVGLLDWAESSSVHVNMETFLEARSQAKDAQVVCLSTCSYEYTDARTAVLCLMIPYEDGEASA